MMKRSMDALIRVFRSGSPTRWKIFRFRGTECSGDVINREGAVAFDVCYNSLPVKAGEWPLCMITLICWIIAAHFSSPAPMNICASRQILLKSGYILSQLDQITLFRRGGLHCPACSRMQMESASLKMFNIIQTTLSDDHPCLKRSQDACAVPIRKFRDRPPDSVSEDAVARSQDVFRRED